MGALGDVIASRAAQAPENASIESARDDRVVTRRQLADLVLAWAARFDAAGIPGGARIGIRGRDPVRFATTWLGIIASGRVAAPIAPDLEGDAFDRWREAAQPWCVIDSSSAAPELTVIGEGATGPAGLMLTSSGTSGPAKLVALREDQILATAASVIAAHELTETDRCLNPLPLWHINGEIVAVLSTVVSGGCVILDDRFHRTGYWQLVADRGATWLNAVPALFSILAREEVSPVIDPRVRFIRSASASLPPSVRSAFELRTGLRVIETYGMTEAGSQITAELLSSDPVGRTPGSVGRPVGLELRIVDASGVTVSPGVRGRVQIRGAAVITEYASAAGAQNLTADGWLDTGDLGFLDPRDELVLDGRGDDIINRGGEKLSPLHLEDALLGVEGVAAVAVVGVPHEILGMVPVAAVVPAEGFVGDLVAAVDERAITELPKIARPVRVHVVPSLNNGVNGKISRKAVLRMLLELGLEAGITTFDPTAKTQAVRA